MVPPSDPPLRCLKLCSAVCVLSVYDSNTPNIVTFHTRKSFLQIKVSVLTIPGTLIYHPYISQNICVR